jgi:hypothetical protein
MQFLPPNPFGTIPVWYRLIWHWLSYPLAAPVAAPAAHDAGEEICELFGVALGGDFGHLGAVWIGQDSRVGAALGVDPGASIQAGTIGDPSISSKAVTSPRKPALILSLILFQ